MFASSDVAELRKQVQEFLNLKQFATEHNIPLGPVSIGNLDSLCYAFLRSTEPVLDEGLSGEYLEKLGFKGINDEHNVDVYTLEDTRKTHCVRVFIYWKSGEIESTVLRLNDVTCYDNPTEKELLTFVRLLGFILPEGL